MDFLKMEGLGNDFVVLEGEPPDRETIRRLCDRRTGVGADGVLLVGPASRPPAALRMEYWNADGSPAEMCGNGLRCAARYGYQRGWTGGADFIVETPMGERRAQIPDPERPETCRVELGEYEVQGEIAIDGREFFLASVGNPHAVTLVDDPELAPVGEVGPRVENHPAFPDRINVGFAAPDRDGAGLRLRVWERGAGETRACGTGAAAAVAVAVGRGLAESPVTVRLPGGPLLVELTGGRAWLTGPARTVFRGSVATDQPAGA